MQGKKADTKTVHDIFDMKSAVVSDPLQVFWRETNYFTIKTQFSYRLLYPAWTLVDTIYCH